MRTKCRQKRKQELERRREERKQKRSKTSARNKRLREWTEAEEIPELVVDLLDKENPRVYRLISSGDTAGVFQMESQGFREMCRKLKPDCFEDIVAAVALYRPGPMQAGMVDDFINRRHGLTPIEFLLPERS